MRRALSFAVFALVAAAPAPAFASYHLTKIVEVYAGGTSAPDAQYVELEAYAPGQNLLSGHALHVYDAAGNETASVPLANVANAADQATVLIGTSEVAAAFGVTPDFVLSSKLAAAGGKVCFEAEPTPIDCFAWGSYAGTTTHTGTPFAALPDGQAAKRKITGGSSPTALDSSDDTDDSAADFAAAAPTPKANPVAPSDAGADASSPGDSGVTTTPTDGGGKLVDAGSDAGSGSSSGGGGDGGCAVATSGSGAPFGAVGVALVAAALAARVRRRR